MHRPLFFLIAVWYSPEDRTVVYVYILWVLGVGAALLLLATTSKALMTVFEHVLHQPLPLAPTG